ncbi:MAG: hypothetical protein CMH54_04490 [Myxococcales bacterium]|nr:hypothetical protein [Myxococcales bacterium]
MIGIRRCIPALALAYILMSTSLYAQGPCLTDADCKSSLRCVNSRCVNQVIATRVAPPSIRIFIDPRKSYCEMGQSIAEAVHSQLTQYLEQVEFPMATEAPIILRRGAEHQLKLIDLALATNQRALVRIQADCAPNATSVDVHLTTLDLAYLRTPRHLSLTLSDVTASIKTHRGSLQRLVNRLRSIDGAPPGAAGSRIAMACKIDRRTKEIYSISPSGTNLRRETRYNNLTMLPSWTHDGLIAATSYVQGNPDIHVDGVPFLTTPGLNTGIDFHGPTGRFVVASAPNDAQHLYLGDSNTGKILKKLTSSRAIDTAPAFSPDGRRITFVSDRSGTPQIYVLRLKDKSVRKISRRGSYNTSPSWSPDGRSIAWARRTYGERHEIVLSQYPPGKAGERVLATGGFSYEDPSFSPDGRNLVVVRKNRKKAEPVVINLRTGKIRSLSQERLPGPCSQPAWGPVLVGR